MKYSPKQFYLDYPPSKRKEDTLFCKFIIRPLSFLFSSFFVFLGIGANAVSIISLLFSFISCGFLIVFYFYNLYLFLYLSLASFFVWAILDCVDGNIARSIKKEKYGDFLDAVAGYIYPGIFISLFGICASRMNNIVFVEYNDILIVLAVVAGTSMITLILANKKFEENDKMYTSGQSENKKHTISFYSIARRVWDELSFGGFMPLILLLAIIFDVSNLVAFFYSICFILMFILGMTYLIAKTILKNRAPTDNN